MYQNNEMYNYLKQVQHNYKLQCEKINSLENIINSLQADIIKIKNSKSLHVDKIEYNFDQLKIETLEGTLNIGISPNGIDSIEEFEVDDNNSLDLTKKIQKQMENYFNKDVFNDISTIEQKNNYFLTDNYKELVINDVKTQMNKQISSYVNKTNREENNNDPEQIEKSIIKNVKNDVTKAIDTFIKQLPREENKN